MYPRPRKRLEERIEMTQMHFDYKHYYPRLLKQPIVKLTPTEHNKQPTKLFQYAGCARFAYNWAINREQENYNRGNKFLSDHELKKEFTRLRHQHSWLKNVSNNVTKQAIKDVCDAYKRFFKGQCRYPKFKSKKRSTPSFYQDNVKIQFTDTHVKVEGFSMNRKRTKQRLNWIRLCEIGRIPTDCKYMNPIMG